VKEVPDRVVDYILSKMRNGENIASRAFIEAKLRRKEKHPLNEVKKEKKGIRRPIHDGVVLMGEEAKMEFERDVKETLGF